MQGTPDFWGAFERDGSAAASFQLTPEDESFIANAERTIAAYVYRVNIGVSTQIRKPLSSS